MTDRYANCIALVAARCMRAVCFTTTLCVLSGTPTVILAADREASPVGTQHRTSQEANIGVTPKTTSAPSSVAAKAPTSPARPLWSELTPAQQHALAPLAGEWDRLGPARKSKWLVIGNKFGTMKPEEQQRVQERMRDWVKLTPEQRRTARENYARAKKLNPGQKSVQWEKYQQLPEEQKKKLAADAASKKKKVVALPSPSQNGGKTVPPIKSTPKPLLEQSVTPQAASQSAIPPSSQPATK